MITDNAVTFRRVPPVTEVPLTSGYSSISDPLNAIKTGQDDGLLQKVKANLDPGDVGTRSKHGI